MSFHPDFIVLQMRALDAQKTPILTSFLRMLLENDPPKNPKPLEFFSTMM